MTALDPGPDGTTRYRVVVLTVSKWDFDSQKAEHTVTVTNETKVTKAGKDATLADVKANDVVAIEAKKGEDNTLTAVRISVT